MAGEQPDADDRTEAATPRRLERAREEGQVALSRDAVGFATLAGVALAGVYALPMLAGEVMRAARDLLAGAGSSAADAATTWPLLRAAGVVIAAGAGAAALAAIAATLAQTGLLLNLKAIAPDLGRLDPLKAAGRLLGPRGLVELGKTLLKFGVVGLALWTAFDPAILTAGLALDPARLLALVGEAARRLLVAALLGLAAIAALDVFLVRHKHAQDLRMSRADLRQETKDSEGDPMIRARLRRLREQRGRQRMLAAVPRATVVITNPTHYAAALAYTAGQAAAPTLVAKGTDAVAARIRAVAEEHGVPIIANPPLARALCRLEPDTEIPPEHWQAVAEILAYVWRLAGRPAPHA